MIKSNAIRNAWNSRDMRRFATRIQKSFFLIFSRLAIHWGCTSEANKQERIIILIWTETQLPQVHEKWGKLLVSWLYLLLWWETIYTVAALVIIIVGNVGETRGNFGPTMNYIYVQVVSSCRKICL